MTMERRGFFKSIAGLFVVAAVDPAALVEPAAPVPGVWFDKDAFSAGMIDLPMPSTIQADMQRLTEFMHRELARELNEMGWRPEPVYKMSDRFVESQISKEFPYQFGVDFELDHDAIGRLSDEEICDRYVRPPMLRIAYEVERLGAKRFAQLPLPSSCGGADIATRVTAFDGISLRGLRAYDMRGYYEEVDGKVVVDIPPGFLHRFDVRLWLQDRTVFVTGVWSRRLPGTMSISLVIGIVRRIARDGRGRVRSLGMGSRRRLRRNVWED